MMKPKTANPVLEFDLVGGGSWSLEESSPENFTMVVFYRGLHCPVCKTYLQTLEEVIDDYRDAGVDVVTVSMDTRERAEKTRNEWGLEKVRVGYGLTENTARTYGLFMSHSIKEEEPELFNEPGLFLFEPDGALYYEALNSMPFGRPDLEDFVGSINWILENDYPSRGEA